MTLENFLVQIDRRNESRLNYLKEGNSILRSRLEYLLKQNPDRLSATQRASLQKFLK